VGDKTSIEWTEATWNPIRGCSRVSAGCVHCYAERQAARFSGPGEPYEGLLDHGHWNGTVRVVHAHLDDPLRWKRPRRIFVNSMSDLFHETLAFEDIARIFGVMAAAPRHTFQILTKRPARMVEFFAWLKGKGDEPYPIDQVRVGERMAVLTAKFDMVNLQERFGPWPLPNVWIGVSVESQQAADERIPLLVETPAAIRWVSMEPLLGPVDLAQNLPGERMLRWVRPMVKMLDWVVVGGESGPEARPMHPFWARDLRDQCAAAQAAFLFKQWGEWAPAMGDLYWYPLDGGPAFPIRGDGAGCYAFGDGYGAVRIGKAKAGRLLDGVEHLGYPIALSA